MGGADVAFQLLHREVKLGDRNNLTLRARADWYIDLEQLLPVCLLWLVVGFLEVADTALHRAGKGCGKLVSDRKATPDLFMVAAVVDTPANVPKLEAKHFAVQRPIDENAIKIGMRLLVHYFASGPAMQFRCRDAFQVDRRDRCGTVHRISFYQMSDP